MNTPSHGSNVDRKDIPNNFKWDIKDIYATQEDWEKACTGLKSLIAELETCQGRLKDPAILLHTLQLRDRLSQEIDKIYAYARLQQDADNGDANAQSLAGKAEGILASFYNAVSFIDSEITSLPKEQLEQFTTDDFGIRWEDLDEDLSFEGFFNKKETTPLYQFFMNHPEINVSAIARRMGISQSLMAPQTKRWI